MEKSLTMPKLGMTMTEGTVLKWFYQQNDFVEKDEVLLEVMTDKVNIEVEAPFSGYLIQILGQEGDTLPVGAPLATFVDTKDEPLLLPIAASSPERVAVASTPAAKREAALQGIDLRVIAQAGSILPLERADVLAFVQRNAVATPPKQETHIQSDRPMRATPVAQKIAQQHQVDLVALAALKPGRKVTRADVEAHLSSGEQVLNDPVPQSPQLSPEAIESELLPLSPVRLLIGQRMLTSVTTMPHIYLDTEIDVTEAERCRQRVGQSMQARGEKGPSLTALLIRALAATLVLHPQVNSAFESGSGPQGKCAIRQWKVVHIGVAVDTGQTLVTPVIRNAHTLSLPALSSELRRLTLLAHEGKLRPDDMAGATFTVSNLGMYGIDTFHAIIAPGQSAILAVGKVTKRGVVIEDKQGERLEIRPMMKVSLSADHRILDGATGSRFLQQFQTFLEDPYLLV